MPFKDYRITSPFGWRNHPIHGGRSFHTGIDLVKSHRTPINAFTEGEVIFAGMGVSGSGFGGYGIVVLIRDKNNRGQVYAHLDSVSVKRGDKVSKGQVIGRQGNTGNSTGSHLHYEVRKSVQTSPPYGWISDRSNNCLEPTKYLEDYYAKPKPVVKGISISGKKLVLPASADSWRVYPLDKAPTVGNESGLLRPSKFGGLEYEILGNPQKDVYTIQTSHFGKVNIFAGPSTSARIVDIVKPKYTRVIELKSPFMRGDDVKAVQTKLGVTPDGVYGQITERAVRAFQQKEKITVDGKVGPQTWNRMF